MKRGALALWCCRWKSSPSRSFPAPSGSLNTHTVRWNLSVALGVFALFCCSPPGCDRVPGGGGQDTDALLALAGIAPPPSCLLALFFPPPPDAFLLQTVPPLCAANHHDNLSGLLLKIHHRSIKN